MLDVFHITFLPQMLFFYIEQFILVNLCAESRTKDEKKETKQQKIEKRKKKMEKEK